MDTSAYHHDGILHRWARARRIYIGKDGYRGVTICVKPDGFHVNARGYGYVAQHVAYPFDLGERRKWSPCHRTYAFSRALQMFLALKHWNERN